MQDDETETMAHKRLRRFSVFRIISVCTLSNSVFNHPTSVTRETLRLSDKALFV